jgi:hypothetical protein
MVGDCASGDLKDVSWEGEVGTPEADRRRQRREYGGGFFHDLRKREVREHLLTEGAPGRENRAF